MPNFGKRYAANRLFPYSQFYLLFAQFDGVPRGGVRQSVSEQTNDSLHWQFGIQLIKCFVLLAARGLMRPCATSIRRRIVLVRYLYY